MLTLTQMASRLGVPPKTVKIWHHAGLITGHPFNDKGVNYRTSPHTARDPPLWSVLTSGNLATSCAQKWSICADEISDATATRTQVAESREPLDRHIAQSRHCAHNDESVIP
jgi:hypothetical protein